MCEHLPEIPSLAIADDYEEGEESMLNRLGARCGLLPDSSPLASPRKFVWATSSAFDSNDRLPLETLEKLSAYQEAMGSRHDYYSDKNSADRMPTEEPFTYGSSIEGFGERVREED